MVILEVLTLEHWCKRIKHIIRGFYSFSCKHTYHEHDRVGDRLSKEALKLDDGHLIAQEFMENSMREYVLYISF